MLKEDLKWTRCFDGTFWLTYSMPGERVEDHFENSGSGLLRSTTGKPEGPYV
jgi:hypothetical protein